MELHWRSKGREPQGRLAHLSIRLQVDSPALMQVDSSTWSDESSLLFVVHVLHLILFVEKYTCGGPRGVRRLLTDLQSGSSPVFFYYYFYSRSRSVYIKGITKKILGIVLKWGYQANGLLQ